MTANALTTVSENFGAISTRFAGRVIEDDLGAGVQGGYPVIKYKGKVWSIRANGEERKLMRPDGDGPMNSIEVVIVKAPKVISKVWYENGYEDGSTAAPDCFSANGIAPDPSSQKKQAPSCAACPKNVFGTGKEGRGKACTDSKRLAVVPLNDIKNELLGGPMMLRVPAASLKAMADYSGMFAKQGYPYCAIGTRIAFDPEEAYPKFVFTAIRPLTDAEADMVLEMQDDPRVSRILAEGTDTPALAAPTQPQATFEQPVQEKVTPQVTKPAAQPTTQPKAAEKPAQVASPATQPAQPAATPATESVSDDFDAKLDALLGSD